MYLNIFSDLQHLVPVAPKDWRIMNAIAGKNRLNMFLIFLEYETYFS